MPFHSLIHLPILFLSIYYRTNVEDLLVNKIDKVSAVRELMFWGEKVHKQINNKNITCFSQNQ